MSWIEILARAVLATTAAGAAVLVAGQGEREAVRFLRPAPVEVRGRTGLSLLADVNTSLRAGESSSAAVRSAPLIGAAAALSVFALLPLSPTVVAAPLPAGLVLTAVLFALVAGALTVSTRPSASHAISGDLRSATTALGAQVALLLSLASFGLAAGTLSLTGISHAWTAWWLLSQAPAAVLLGFSVLVLTRRRPFDDPEQDGRPTGLDLLATRFTQHAASVAGAAVIAVLYLGGWTGPFDAVLGWWWTIAKTALVLAALFAVRTFRPRPTVEGLQRAVWLVAVPAAFAQVLLSAVLVVSVGGAS